MSIYLQKISNATLTTNKQLSRLNHDSNAFFANTCLRSTYLENQQSTQDRDTRIWNTDKKKSLACRFILSTPLSRSQTMTKLSLLSLTLSLPNTHFGQLTPPAYTHIEENSPQPRPVVRCGRLLRREPHSLTLYGEGASFYLGGFGRLSEVI